MNLEEVFDMRDFTELEVERLKHEIAVIKRARCEQEIINAIEEIKAIPPEKEFYISGAANCSFLLYTLGITKVDSMRFDLPFERFVNPLREDTTPFIQPEFIPKSHIQTDLTLEELIVSQVMNEEPGDERILISKYKNQPLYDILYETRGKFLWQEQFINILNRVGGMLPEVADIARQDISKYGRDDWRYDTYFDWFVNHSERLGYNTLEMVDFFDYVLINNLRSANNKAHYLARAIHNYDCVQTPNEKRTAVICFGEGYRIAKHISPKRIASYRCYDTRLELKKIIEMDKDLCENSSGEMSKKDFIIYAGGTNGLDAVDNEEVGERVAKNIEMELKKYIQKLKLNGVNKLIVIAYSGTFEYHATKLVHKICKKNNLPCDIYAYHIGKDLFPDISSQEKHVIDLQENCSAEILLYPKIDDYYCTPYAFEDINKQYAKTIEYTCL